MAKSYIKLELADKTIVYQVLSDEQSVEIVKMPGEILHYINDLGVTLYKEISIGVESKVIDANPKTPPLEIL